MLATIRADRAKVGKAGGNPASGAACCRVGAWYGRLA